MNWSVIKLIFRRELRDQLRDRRMLFVVFVLPIILYPLMGFGVVQLNVRFRRVERKIAIQGYQHLPVSPPLLSAKGETFHESLTQYLGNYDFHIYRSDASATDVLPTGQHHVGSQTKTVPAKDVNDSPKPVGSVQPNDESAGSSSTHDSAQPSPNSKLPTDQGPASKTGTANEQSSSNHQRAWASVDVFAGKLDLLIVVPENAQQRLKDGASLNLVMVHNSASDASVSCRLAVEQVLQNWENVIVTERLKSLGKTLEFVHPIEASAAQVDLAKTSQKSSAFWGRIIPFILVMMALTGAFYPAIDLCAGEKERGTMETLLVSPAKRSEIVLGKFLTVMLFSIATTMTNLASMGLTFGQLTSMLPSAGREGLAMPFSAVLWMLVLMIPLAAFFSALSMACAIFARSAKEGQYYLVPLCMIVSPLVLMTTGPGAQLNPVQSLIPVTNVALLLKTMIVERFDQAAAYFIPVTMTTMVYGYVALRFAADQFNREEVLFREAERFDVYLWLKRLLHEKHMLPTFGQAWACFMLMLIPRLYFQGWLPATPWAVALSLFLFILLPPLLMTGLFCKDWVGTLRLAPSSSLLTMLAGVLALAMHPVCWFIGIYLTETMPESMSTELSEQLRWITELSLGWKLLLLALLPACVEEIAFRGFILNGLVQQYTAKRAIVVTAALFGISHMIPQQMLIATTVGIILGFLAIRTNSIWPPIVFHAIHNGLMVWRAEFSKSGHSAAPTAGEITVTLIGILASLLLIGFLARYHESDAPSEEFDLDADEPVRS